MVDGLAAELTSLTSAANLPRWWERYPGRLEHELAQLNAADLTYKLDERARAEQSVIRLDLEMDVSGPEGGALRRLRLEAAFPDNYPFVRVSVRSKELTDLRWHRHPFSGDLCLLARGGRAWQVDDTLAGMLVRIPLLLATGSQGSAERPAPPPQDEQPQAEPFSDYYSCLDERAAVLVDGRWAVPPDENRGEISLAMRPWVPDRAGQRLFGAVAEVRGESSETLLRVDGRLLDRIGPERLVGRWARLSGPLTVNTPGALWAAATAADRSLHQAPATPVGPDGWRARFLAVLFPEEVGHRTSGWGWLFLVRLERAFAGGRKGSRRLAPGVQTLAIRAMRAGPADMLDRVPDLAGLGAGRVLVVGLGALGGQISVELGRAGVGYIAGMDGDIVDPGTLPRHVSGLDHVGLPKVESVGYLTAQRNPFSDVRGTRARIGNVRWDGGEREDVGLADLVADVDLVVDATAEENVQHLLSDVCARSDTAYVCVSATNGGWGGMVARWMPGAEGGCWVCLQHHLTDGSIPRPPAATSPFVQPVGCADPTFTGTGFDIMEVAVHAARVAVGTLSQLVGSSYRYDNSDVAILRLRTDDGQPVPPSWTAHALPRHPECTGHT